MGWLCYWTIGTIHKTKWCRLAVNSAIKWLGPKPCKCDWQSWVLCEISQELNLLLANAWPQDHSSGHDSDHPNTVTARIPNVFGFRMVDSVRFEVPSIRNRNKQNGRFKKNKQWYHCREWQIFRSLMFIILLYLFYKNI